MAEPGLSEIITTTLRKRQKVLRDNITNNNAILKSMDEEGSLEVEDGGRTILEEMFYAENGTFIRYDGGQVLNTSYNTTMTSAEFDWKQFAAAVVITGKDERMNSGAEGVIKLLKNRIKACEYTLENNYNSDLLSDGTSDSGKQIGGLALLVSKTPTSGTVGGIDRSATGGAFYRNFKFDVINDVSSGAPGGAATSSANIQSYLNWCFINTTRGVDRPNLLMMGNQHYAAFKGSMQSIQRIVEVGKANSGFKTLEYEGVPVVLGGGVSYGGESLLTTDRTYGLNTKFIKVREHKNARMEPLPEVQSINQDAKVQIVVWMGNATLSNAKAQFVMFDS